jgi:hypothetical protein
VTRDTQRWIVLAAAILAASALFVFALRRAGMRATPQVGTGVAPEALCTLSVLRNDGTQLPHAEAWTDAGARIAVANERGVLELRADTPLTYVDIRAEGFVTRRCVPIAGAHSITLTPTAALAVEVQWADLGEPVVGAEVVLGHAASFSTRRGAVDSSPIAATTDASGRALLAGLDRNDPARPFLRIQHPDAPFAYVRSDDFAALVGASTESVKVLLERQPSGVRVELHDARGLALSDRSCRFEGTRIGDDTPTVLTDERGVARFPWLRSSDVFGGPCLLVDVDEGRMWWDELWSSPKDALACAVDYRTLSGIIVDGPSKGCEVASIPLRMTDPEAFAGLPFGGACDEPFAAAPRARFNAKLARDLDELDWHAPSADGRFVLRSGWQAKRTAVIARDAMSHAPLCITEVRDAAEIVLRYPPTCALTIEIDNDRELAGTLALARYTEISDRGPPVPEDCIRIVSPQSGTHVLRVPRGRYVPIWNTTEYRLQLSEVDACGTSARIVVDVPESRSLSGNVSGTLTGATRPRALTASFNGYFVARARIESDGSYVFPALPQVALTLDWTCFYDAGWGSFDCASRRLVEAMQTEFSLRVPEAALEISLEAFGPIESYVELLIDPVADTRQAPAGRHWEHWFQLGERAPRFVVAPGEYDVKVRCLGLELLAVRVSAFDRSVQRFELERLAKALVEVRSELAPSTFQLMLEMRSSERELPLVQETRSSYLRREQRILTAFLVEPGAYTLRVSGGISQGARTVPFEQTYAVECSLVQATTIVLRE